MRRVARRAGSWRCWGAEGKFAGPPTPFEFRGNLRVTDPETEKAREREIQEEESFQSTNKLEST